MHVSALAYYPIKSCGWTSVQEAELDDCGIVNDRRFLITDPDGMFKTQREHRGLARIQPQLEGDRLTVSAPDMEPLSIDAVPDGHRLQVQIFRSTCQAVDQGDAIAEWLSTYLKTPCRLVTMAPDFVRPVNPALPAIRRIESPSRMPIHFSSPRKRHSMISTPAWPPHCRCTAFAPISLWPALHPMPRITGIR
jgi:uncharacterized protein YcbX